MPILSWLTRDEDIQQAAKVPYRLLDPISELSYGDPDAENMLIQGDNLDALKALLPYYAGQVKCIFIDPPYNTRSAFAHYDDNLEHTKWLEMMYPRLDLLRELLAEDGSIWVTIDDNEGHYLKVLMDEIFGRNNFVANIVWQKRYSRENREAIGDVHDHILVYASNTEKFKKQRNLLPLGEKQRKLYKNPDNDSRGAWQSVSLLAQGYRPNQMYEIIGPTGKIHLPPPGNCWKVIRSEYDKLLAENRVYFGKDGNGVPRRKEFINKAKGLVPWTWWPHEEVGHTDEAKKECNVLFGSDISFGTPKPERLIQRILFIATEENDLVLDSFLGSGTTAAVAHKMGRRYIGIEMGDQAVTHCQKRLQKVIDGEQGGISITSKVTSKINLCESCKDNLCGKCAEAVSESQKGGEQVWFGGGGFKFYRLGEAVFDEDGQIQPAIKFPTLAAHVWFTETNQPYQGQADSPLLGIQDNTAIGLLYNGILGDKRVNGGNVLTHKLLADIRAQAPRFDGPLIIYGECSRISPDRLREEKIIFKQTPYDIKVR